MFTPLLTYDPRTLRRRPDPDRVYVAWQDGAAGTTLRISKQLWPTPEHVDVNSPEVPHLTRLAPGEVLEETLELERSLRLDHPYQTAFKKERRSGALVRTRADDAVFAIGYLSKDPQALRLEPTETGSYTVPYGLGFLNQRLIERPLALLLAGVGYETPAAAQTGAIQGLPGRPR